MTKTEILKLKRLFKNLPIEAVYLYGSQAKGESDRLSDYDFGFIFWEKLSKTERFDLRLKLFGELAKRLKVSEDKVDVVDLKEVPLLLQFNAISGRLLYCRHQAKRVSFESYVLERICYEHYYLDRYFRETLAKIEKGDYFERRIAYP